MNSYRHAGHCWRSRDELIRDVLLWIPTHDRAKAGRPARTYIQQLCEDTGCCPEDLPRAMNDREEWRERVGDIRATSAIWWWWWYIYVLTIIFFINIHFNRISFLCGKGFHLTILSVKQSHHSDDARSLTKYINHSVGFNIDINLRTRMFTW